LPRNFPKTKPVKDWKSLISSYSPYLTSLLSEETREPADRAFERALRLPDKPGDLMAALRRLKRRAAFVTAVADLKGEWDDLKAMAQLSRFADFCVRECLKHLLLEAHRAKKIKLKSLKNPEEECGVVIIALGKWGAHELNYSSDIDLMVVFDPQRAPVRDRDEAQAFFTRLTRDLADMMERPTADGYVFRTDLRLRPDPGAMPLAISIAAAETYYGSLGQNWERAAMIKARPVAGDMKTGADFMAIMKTWIWRRNLDFAAIQDINSVKRQINAKVAHKVKGGNPFLNFNVKLGHGGIREIEFFAQTQQLIYGGREPALRASDTLSALKALAEAGLIEASMRDDLTKAYLFLRRVEHRLQMREDRQTHSLPAKQEDFDDVAGFMGYAKPVAFLTDLEKHTGCVRKLYAGLFTESPSLAGPGNLVFTGVEDDPDTLETLRKVGFKAPATVTAAVRGWHHGRYRAMRTERARQILTELIPPLLETLAATPQPDDAFIRFDGFLGRLPAGVPIFSMFAHNPDLMKLVAEVLGASPVMAGELGAHPHVLEGALSKDFFGPLPGAATLKADLARQMAVAEDYEDSLNVTRRFAREHRFRAGVHVLRNISDDVACGAYYADIAEAVLSCLTPRVEEEFAKAHGQFKTGAYALLGMGSFAARRMFSNSDLDLVALYDVAEDEEASDGAKPLPPSAYYMRLTQRLITALSAPTAEGTLYEADFRLRPDGEKGPLAVRVSGFIEYQKNKAWAWEHMSLIRGRMVYGPGSLCRKVEAARLAVLASPRDAGALKAEMLDMRNKVEKQFGSKDAWRVKYVRGGMMDVMFVAHYLALTSGQKDVFSPAVNDCLDALRRAKILKDGDYKALSKAGAGAFGVMQFLYLCSKPPFRPDDAPEGLKTALARRMGGKGKGAFAAASKAMAGEFRESYAVFRKVFGE
jgi:glutamate-ammonia-ligase adenylyltransferase